MLQQFVAENRLAEIELGLVEDDAPATMLGRAFRVSATRSATDDPDLERLDVAVSDGARSQSVMGFLGQAPARRAGAAVNRPSRRGLLWIAAAVVAVAAGIAAGPLAWRLAGGGRPPAPGPAAQQDGGAAPVALDPIIALSPFGRVAEPPAPEPERQETGLSLVLLGVVIATDPRASTAILEGGSGPSRVYVVGAEVAPGATLEAVFVDHVTLRVDGRVETLSFPNATGGAAPPPPARPRTPPPARPRRWRTSWRSIRA